MYEFLDYRVAHVMTTRLITIQPRTSLVEVEKTFEEHNFNSLPVIEEGNRLVGIVSKLDLLKAFTFTPKSIIPPYEEIMRQPADSVMSREPVTVSPDAPLTRVIETMIATRNKSFPVVEKARLVGMVAREDILGALRRAVAGGRPRAPSSGSGDDGAGQT